ncbi:MAG TPA: AbrB/MazE/SpoVT family DNA-binding domain-containing protein [Desulfocapsa sulfexigens]|nr:AbrB/MazE/SpoVT family DNA-binding domain-containing protein [Desulfocapsa sulfexigens]
MQATISSKYQMVIPKPVREHLNLNLKVKQKLTAIEKDKMLTLFRKKGSLLDKCLIRKFL